MNTIYTSQSFLYTDALIRASQHYSKIVCDAVAPDKIAAEIDHRTRFKMEIINPYLCDYRINVQNGLHNYFVRYWINPEIELIDDEGYPIESFGEQDDPYSL